MNPVRKQRLIIVIFVVVFASLAVGLMTFALRKNINLFYPPSAMASGEAPHNTTIRGGGCVKPGSVVRSQTSLDVHFLITDGAADVPVVYSGILPDLFAEGEAAVVNGKIGDDGVFNATQVLAKHDETYTPPEVAEAVGNVNEHQKSCEGMSYGR